MFDTLWIPFLVAVLVLGASCEGEVIRHSGIPTNVVEEPDLIDMNVQDVGDELDEPRDLSSGIDLGGPDLVEDLGVDLGGMTSGPDMSHPLDMGPPDMGPPPNPDGFYLDQVKWLDPNIATWEQSATLSSVTFERQSRDICLNYTIPGGGTWPVVQIFGTTDVVANAWIFIEHNGQWHGATWEWMRPGQVCKAITSVAASHIKKSPFQASSGWAPQSGDVFYFMVSGLIRNNMYHNVSRRSNVVRVVWP